MGDVLAADPDLAITHLLESRHQAERRGLAAARGAEQHRETALGHLKRDPVDGDGVAPSFAHEVKFNCAHLEGVGGIGSRGA